MPPAGGPPPAYEAYAAGEVAAAMSDLHPDIVWRVTGRNPLAGEDRGHGQVKGVFREAAQLCGGAFRREIHDILGGDEDAVVPAVWVSCIVRAGYLAGGGHPAPGARLAA